MLRSIRRRSWSCAATRRWREARRSSISFTLRSTGPAWAARSWINPSFAGFIGSFAGMSTVIAPSSSPRCRTSYAPRSAASAIANGSSPSPPDVDVAPGRSSAPLVSQIVARAAPVPADEREDPGRPPPDQALGRDPQDEQDGTADQDREDQGDRGLLDHDVDVVEAVLQDGNGDRDRKKDESDAESDVVSI